MNKERIAKKLIRLAEDLLEESDEEKVRTKPIEDGWVHYYTAPDGTEFELYEVEMSREAEYLGETPLMVEVMVNGKLDFSEIFHEGDFGEIAHKLERRYPDMWEEVRYYVKLIPV